MSFQSSCDCIGRCIYSCSAFLWFCLKVVAIGFWLLSVQVLRSCCETKPPFNTMSGQLKKAKSAKTGPSSHTKRNRNQGKKEQRKGSRKHGKKIKKVKKPKILKTRESSVEEKSVEPDSEQQDLEVSRSNESSNSPVASRVTSLGFSLLDLDPLVNNYRSEEHPASEWRKVSDSKRKKRKADMKPDYKSMVVSWPQKPSHKQPKRPNRRSDPPPRPNKHTDDRASQHTQRRHHAPSTTQKGRTRPPLPHNRSRVKSPAQKHTRHLPSPADTSPRRVGSYPSASNDVHDNRRYRHDDYNRHHDHSYQQPRARYGDYERSASASPTARGRERSPNRHQSPHRQLPSPSRSPSRERESSQSESQRHELSSSVSSQAKYSSSPLPSPPAASIRMDTQDVRAFDDLADTNAESSDTSLRDDNSDDQHETAATKDKIADTSDSHLTGGENLADTDLCETLRPSPSASMSPSTSPCVSPEMMCQPTFLGYPPFLQPASQYYHNSYYGAPPGYYNQECMRQAMQYQYFPPTQAYYTGGYGFEQPAYWYGHAPSDGHPSSAVTSTHNGSGHDVVSRPHDFRFTHVLNDTERESVSRYCPNVFGEDLLEKWFETIRAQAQWSSHETCNPRFGNKVPRLVAWYTNHPCTCEYSYSGITCESCDTPDWLQQIQTVVFKSAKISVVTMPDSCNINLYRDGSDCAGWHQDDEELFDSLNKPCLIVSFSLGASRWFEFRRLYSRDKTNRLLLSNGDILTMEGRFQRYYQHRVPMEERMTGSRINLTWRWIQKHNPGCSKSRNARE